MIKIKNWSSYQSYKDRKPPWIRLHKTLLDDYNFQRMSADSRALLPMLWLLASEHKNPTCGIVPYSPDEIIFRLRIRNEVITESLREIEKFGFIQVIHDVIESCNETVTKPYLECEIIVTPEKTETDSEKERLLITDRESRSPDKPPRATRLKLFLENNSEDATAKAWGEWALSIGADEILINQEMAKFCDYWNAIPGQRGVKLDWGATWRNWCRRAVNERKEKEMKNEVFANKFRK